DCAGYIDSDGDTFCFVGSDMNMNGVCTDPGEQSGLGDCDESTTDIRPTAREDCTDGIDNDCDGSTDGAERGSCDAYRDLDGDGWCFAGQDMDGDGYCDDAGEQTELSEWTADEDPFSGPDTLGTEESPVRYPGAPENCRNMIDEDLDGLVDESGYCRTDVDMDGDGYCPIGTDVNMDGDCEDAGENRGLDCNDGDPTVHTDAEERCLDPVDADCDGKVGTRDEDCFFLLDLDGDGLCGMGIDDNADGDCLDESEDRFGSDCDERDPAVNSRAREASACDDGIDNDCDGAIDYDDTQCECMSDDVCDDGDPCTTDTCSDRVCTHAADATCGDGGMTMMMADGGTTMMPPAEGCSCRAGGSSRAPAGLLLIGIGAVMVLGRRRRR
ncbi:MAG: MopE-related protein, partial [Sandaracinaceae bacterium]